MTRFNEKRIKRRLELHKLEAMLEPFAEALIERLHDAAEKDFDAVRWLQRQGVDCGKDDVRHFLAYRELRRLNYEIMATLAAVAAHSETCAAASQPVTATPNLYCLCMVIM
jgi:hypothetical protein